MSCTSSLIPCQSKSFSSSSKASRPAPHRPVAARATAAPIPLRHRHPPPARPSTFTRGATTAAIRTQNQTYRNPFTSCPFSLQMIALPMAISAGGQPVQQQQQQHVVYHTVSDAQQFVIRPILHPQQQQQSLQYQVVSQPIYPQQHFQIHHPQQQQRQQQQQQQQYYAAPTPIFIPYVPRVTLTGFPVGINDAAVRHFLRMDSDIIVRIVVPDHHVNNSRNLLECRVCGSLQGLCLLQIRRGRQAMPTTVPPHRLERPRA